MTEIEIETQTRFEFLPPVNFLPELSSNESVELFNSRSVEQLKYWSNWDLEGGEYLKEPLRQLVLRIGNTEEAVRSALETIGKNNFSFVYVFTLDSKTKILEGRFFKRPVTLQEATFIGPIKPGDTQESEGVAIVIGLRNKEVEGGSMPRYTIHKGTIAEELRVTNPESEKEEPKKFWFTGNHGPLASPNPGYNGICAIGLAHVGKGYSEQESIWFKRGGFQLAIPLPTLKNPDPQITYYYNVTPVEGILEEGKEKVTAYQAGGTSTPLLEGVQWKKFGDNTTFLLVNCLGRAGIYGKTEGWPNLPTAPITNRIDERTKA